VALLAALILVIPACGDDAEGITVEGAWARNSPMTAGAGAGYLKVTSPVADTLVGITVDATVAEMGELHDVVEVSTGTTIPGSMDLGTGMMMIPIDAIPLPAGEQVVLEPGHLHLMFVGLAGPLEIGQKFDVTLQFETADDLVVEFEGGSPLSQLTESEGAGPDKHWPDSLPGSKPN
jgi:copper(I)-binding protein